MDGDWRKKRAMGVMMHISCLPSEQGIGCFNQDAFTFIDFLANSGMRYWQICPLSPTTYGDSPYQGLSSFALNPYFIDFESLGIETLQKNTDETRVPFGELYDWFQKNLTTIHKGLTSRFGNEASFIQFLETQHDWLDAYALFAALKDSFNGAPWYQWPANYRRYEAIKKIPKSIAERKQTYQLLQFAAYQQWRKLKAYANKKKIQIIGDLPMFPGYDSADVWNSPRVFQLGNDLKPRYVAGVPPDYFSPEGQLWGNPVYDWSYLKSTKFDWWNRRIKQNLALYDVLRLDHFRGFDRYWCIPEGAPNAIDGEWEPAFGRSLLKKFVSEKFIAENLGVLDQETEQLRKDLGIPGMSVLQFAFSSDPSNSYLPHNLTQNNILYLGTHDNDTLLGWYQKLGDAEKNQIREYFGISDEQMRWKFLTEAYRSPCFLAILCVQDLLNLGSEARFNTPGTSDSKNWTWRLTREQLALLREREAPLLKAYKERYGR